MKACFIAIALFVLGLSPSSFAEEPINIHVSANGAITVNGRPVSSMEEVFDINKKHSIKSYIQKGNASGLQPGKNREDADKLADSIEFEVFEVGEGFSSRSVYASGAGICRGYQSKNGVELMDSSTYYVPGTETDYYNSISSATLSQMTDPQNVQYASAVKTSDKQKENVIRSAEAKYGRKMVSDTIKEREALLYHTVCRSIG